MAENIATVVYGGVRYPISHEVAESIIDKIESFQVVAWSDFVKFATTDGRYVMLRVGQGLPIAFESAADSE